MVVYVVYGGAMRKYMWAPEQILAKYGRKTGGGEEVVLPGVGCPGLMAGCPGCRMSGLVGPDIRALDPRMNEKIFEREVKSGENSGEFWMEIWENGWKARSTCNTRNPRIKSNKTSSHQQITKNNLGLFLWAIFELGTKSTKQG